MDQHTHRLLSSLFTGAPTPRTVTLTSSVTSYTVPLSVSNLKTAVGKGSDGSSPSNYYVQRYECRTYTNSRVRSTGEVHVTDQGTTTGYGTVPSNYCDPATPLPSNPTYSETWNCYYFTDTSYWDYAPGTNGTASTAFGKTFPGGAEGPAPTTSYSNVAVTPGQAYPVSIPPGGYITITFDEITI